jgi:lipopolysaccharide transport system ATP-binding protein
MSSDDVAISVHSVGKCFRVYDRPADRLKQILVPRVRSVLGGVSPTYHREFWALRDITFQVRRGETVGIIGRNGSGKSTLLQIITGTMEPTLGTVLTSGRIAALLELGSGFNPEFTGRENVFLNGNLLGLSRAEVEAKFDYIAGFADIGEHLDQPVKTYSSGMTLRLAFAVQVAVDADVLIIDEALAVGDARFQLKCFKRLEELKARGVTILFVSHATELVRSFCNFGLVLEQGKSIFWGDAKAATIKYLATLFPEQAGLSASESPAADTPSSPDTMSAQREKEERLGASLVVDPAKLDTHTFGVGGAVLERLEIHGLDGPNILVGGRAIVVRCEFSWDVEFIGQLLATESYRPDITLGIALSDKKGSYLFGCNGFDKGLSIDCTQAGRSAVEFRLVLPHLVEGDYFLSVAIALGALDNHVQLKWYDSMVQLKYLRSDKNVFGLLGIDYEMDAIAIPESGS